MRCSKRTILILSVLALGCTPAEPSTDTPKLEGAVHRFDNNWGSDPMIGCTPRGDTLTLRGTIVVRAFGKGSDGVVLQVGPSEDWILAYRAEGVLLEHDGEHVEITGRACAKGGQAIFGDHFDLATLVVLRPS